MKADKPVKKESEEQDPMEVLAAAQKKAQDNVIRDRVALIDSMAFLSRIHGTDDYEQSISEIIEKREDAGVPMPWLRAVHPDGKRLDEAIKSLEADGKVKTEKSGKTQILFAA